MAFSAVLGILPPSVIARIDASLPLPLQASRISSYLRSKMSRFSSPLLTDVSDKVVDMVSFSIVTLHQTMSVPEILTSREVSLSFVL